MIRATLHRASLHYAPDFVLHTASSGAVPELDELYLLLERDGVRACGEVRVNIAYLNGLAADQVIAGTRAALAALDATSTPEAWLAAIHAGGHLAPVRMLFDAALHDLMAREAKTTVAHLLGGGKGPVRSASNQTLFWSSHERFVSQAKAYVARGFNDIKVRIGIGDFAEDLQRIDTLRDLFGDEVHIAADANGTWGADVVLDCLGALADRGLSYVEQPVAQDDWALIERLSHEAPLGVMLDESAATEADIERICRIGGKLMAHLKLVKLGGLKPMRAATARLHEAGVPFMIGQMNEGAVATATALHAVAAFRPTHAELYGADGLLNDPATGLIYDRGGAGTGIAPGNGTTFDPAKAVSL